MGQCSRRRPSAVPRALGMHAACHTQTECSANPPVSAGPWVGQLRPQTQSTRLGAYAARPGGCKREVRAGRGGSGEASACRTHTCGWRAQLSLPLIRALTPSWGPTLQTTPEPTHLPQALCPLDHPGIRAPTWIWEDTVQSRVDPPKLTAAPTSRRERARK